MKKGFALPTVLIASVVLLMVLAVSVTATTATRNGLKTQYYAQLAQSAGEAGVAFANACLRLSGNVPTWTNAKPLTPATNCNGDVQSGYPATVVTNGNIQSKFRVGLPSVDADGRALTIPQTGFVEVMRTSTGAVWRTYQQPASQPMAVPELCSGAARSDLGWNNAVLSPVPYVLTGGPSAQTISTSTSANVYPGKVTYRKDFTVNEAASYTVSVRADSPGVVFLDGAIVGAFSGAGGQFNVSVNPGCHVLTVQEQRPGTSPSAAGMALAMYKTGGTQPIVVSDRTWRTSVANATDFKQANYFNEATGWPAASSIAAFNGAPYAAPSSWAGQTADGSATWISAASDGIIPIGSTSYFRANPVTWTLTAPMSLRFTTACDGTCNVYVDGQLISTGSGDPTVTTQATISLEAGRHQVLVELTNDGTGPAQTAFLMNVKNVANNANFDRSGTQWTRADRTTPTPEAIYSYEDNFRPSPDIYDCNCPTPGAVNLLATTSFEEGGRPDNQSLNSTNQVGAAFHGTRFVRASVSSVAANQRTQSTTFFGEAGMTYTLSAYTRSTVGTRIGYIFINRFGNMIPVNNITINYSSMLAGDNTWKRLSIVTPPAPPGTTQVMLVVGPADNSPVGTAFDLDALMISQGPALRAYADNTSPGWRNVNVNGANMSTGPVL